MSVSKFWKTPQDERDFFNPKGVVYEKLNINTLESAIDCISYNLSTYEPMNLALKTIPGENLKKLRKILNNSYNYSYVARNIVTNKVVGVLVGNNLDFFNSNDFSNELPDKFSPISAARSELENNFLSRKKYDSVDKQSIFYIFALCVNKIYRDTGVSLRLIRLLEKKIIESRFFSVFALSSVKSVQKSLVNTHRFKEIDRIWYQNFRYAGNQPFYNIENTDYYASYYRKL